MKAFCECHHAQDLLILPALNLLALNGYHESGVPVCCCLHSLSLPQRSFAAVNVF